MDERALLLLGLLKTQSQHGYQINEFIEKNLRRIINMKKSTAYTILDRLAQAGCVTVHTEQEGNRPPRKVFAITPEGEEQFYSLLRENLAKSDPLLFPGDIGLMFLEHLPADEVVGYLQQRLTQVDEQLQSFERAPIHRYNRGSRLAVDHVQTLLRAERGWLQETIMKLGEE